MNQLNLRNLKVPLHQRGQQHCGLYLSAQAWFSLGRQIWLRLKLGFPPYFWRQKYHQYQDSTQRDEYLQIFSLREIMFRKMTAKVKGIRISLDGQRRNISAMLFHLLDKLLHKFMVKIVYLNLLGGNDGFHIQLAANDIVGNYQLLAVYNSQINNQNQMIDQVQQKSVEGNKATQNSPQNSPSNSNSQNTEALSSPGKKEKEMMQQLIKSYLKQSTSIHRQRLQRLQQANQIIGKQCRAHESELEKIKQNKANFNKQLDMMIAMLKQIDRVEGGIMECQRNAKLIFELIGQIQKKLSDKIHKKIESIKKQKK